MPFITRMKHSIILLLKQSSLLCYSIRNHQVKGQMHSNRPVESPALIWSEMPQVSGLNDKKLTNG